MLSLHEDKKKGVFGQRLRTINRTSAENRDRSAITVYVPDEPLWSYNIFDNGRLSTAHELKTGNCELSNFESVRGN